MKTTYFLRHALLRWLALVAPILLVGACVPVSPLGTGGGGARGRQIQIGSMEALTGIGELVDSEAAGGGDGDCRLRGRSRGIGVSMGAGAGYAVLGGRGRGGSGDGCWRPPRGGRSWDVMFGGGGGGGAHCERGGGWQ